MTLPFETRLTFGTRQAIQLHMAKRWLARLSMSFVIIAMWLIWTAFHQPKVGSGLSGRQMLYLVGAGASLSLAVAGFRERHRVNRFED